MTPTHDTPPDAFQRSLTPPWLRRVWYVMELRIGIVPVPIFVILLGLIGYFLTGDKFPNEISMSIVLLCIGGFACGEIGKRLPIFRHIGAAAIFATFIPSYLAFNKFLPEAIQKQVVDFTKSTNFLYLFITCIIVGSILSMDRNVLVKGFVKIFIPLALGSIAAGMVGTLVGTLLGLGAWHTFYFIVIPIMAGGVGEGAIPLSVGYSEILHQPQGEMFATVLPSVMLGSLTAILLSGTLNFVGKRYPHLTGEGRLQPGHGNEIAASDDAHTGAIDATHVAAAGITAITFYLFGIFCQRITGLPAPVAMLFTAVVIKLARVVPPELQAGASVVYKFFATAVTYPLLFAIGVSITPWDKLMAAFEITNVITIVATVVTLMTVGFFVGRLLNMYPIESAIVNACHSGQGGTGDVAILTAANRMQLMPFAQISTRIGGAITVTLTLIALSQFGH